MTISYDDARVGDVVDVPSELYGGCGVRGPGNYWCTRAEGHGGQHVGAGSLGHVYEVWPAEGFALLTDELIRDLKDSIWVHVAAVVRPGADVRGTLQDVDRAISGVLVDALRVLADRPLDPEGLSALADRIENG